MITHLSVLAKKFYAGCPSCRNPPHLSGLGIGSKRHRKCASDGWVIIFYIFLYIYYIFLTIHVFANFKNIICFQLNVHEKVKSCLSIAKKYILASLHDFDFFYTAAFFYFTERNLLGDTEKLLKVLNLKDICHGCAKK